MKLDVDELMKSLEKNIEQMKDFTLDRSELRKKTLRRLTELLVEFHAETEKAKAEGENIAGPITAEIALHAACLALMTGSEKELASGLKDFSMTALMALILGPEGSAKLERLMKRASHCKTKEEAIKNGKAVADFLKEKLGVDADVDMKIASVDPNGNIGKLEDLPDDGPNDNPFLDKGPEDRLKKAFDQLGLGNGSVFKSPKTGEA